MKEKQIINESSFVYLDTIKDLYGRKVRRGPTWIWDEQDGPGSIGTVVQRPNSEGWISVVWDSGNSNVYRLGWWKGFFYEDLVPAEGGNFVSDYKIKECVYESKGY